MAMSARKKVNKKGILRLTKVPKNGLIIPLACKQEKNQS
jgi:hypothetical protein